MLSSLSLVGYVVFCALPWLEKGGSDFTLGSYLESSCVNCKILTFCGYASLVLLAVNTTFAII